MKISWTNINIILSQKFNFSRQNMFILLCPFPNIIKKLKTTKS